MHRVISIFSLVLSVMLFACVRSQAAAADISYNTCGIVNRPLSVDPTGLSEGFSAVLYDNASGLPTSEANAIAETEEGFIWIGSYAGLIRYDGSRFERLDSTGGITSIKSLYVDDRDRLWIGTNDNGVAVMERGSIRIWGKTEGMCSAHTRAITGDRKGTIYVATTNGIMMFDEDFNLTKLEDPAIAEADMRELRTGSDGTVYGSTDHGDLMMIRDGRLIRYISTDDSTLGGVGAIMPDPEVPGRLYQEAADFNLYHVDINDDFKILDKIEISPLKYIKQIEYIDGKMWICATNGIGVLDEDGFHLMEGLPMSNNVGRVMTDYLGNLWFTSTRQGVMKVVPNQFSDLFVRYDIPETVVNATCMIDGHLFIATDTGLIVLDEKGPLSHLPLKKAVTASGRDLEADDLISFLDGCRIRSVIRDSRDRLWISTWRDQGLLRYDHGELTAFTEEDGLLTNNLRAIAERDDGTILVALTGGVNVIRDDQVIAAFDKEDGIENIESLTVAEGKGGDIVLGSNGGGIYVFNEEGLKKTINVEEGLPSDIVMRLKRDTNRDLIWIVTSNAIACMTPEYEVTTIKKFPYPNNFDLYESARGDMWILSSNGIYVLPVDELLENGEINPVFFNRASGLSCIATANSYSELTPEGDLYIAGSTGVCKVNIEKPFEDVNELKAVVPYIEADGEKIYPDDDGMLMASADTHKLTVFGFVYNYSLSDPLVSYRLDGFDDHSTTVNRSEMQPVDYTNLRGGTYHFVMQVQDSLGRGNKVVTVTIVKEKAFYETAWFFIACTLLAMALIALFVRSYIKHRMLKLEKKHQEAREQFEQTAEALASAIDAKDTYTNGHSRRVAEYSVKIAQMAGKSEEECEKVYFAALLHDVGKIGVPIEILTKNGRLTDEEFDAIKQHPVAGGQILSKIKQSPWLGIGAKYHHERYNGKGYPEGLKGDETPEIARIIAVADAYDAMTSNRSYRNAIPQHIVREELVKGSGTQFDPVFARIMIHMIDLDTEYLMKESVSGANITNTGSLRCDEIYHDCSAGIGITRKMAGIRLCSQPDDGFEDRECLPTLILYDSLDGDAHPGEEENPNLLYYEYAQIRLDGQVTERNIRKYEVRECGHPSGIGRVDHGETERGQRYMIKAVRNKDHVLVRVSGEERSFDVILALQDTSRYVYISLSGEHCEIHNIRVEIEKDGLDATAIPRIAEEISYIRECREGDLPNLQIDGPQLGYSKGIPIEDDLVLSFHTKSLPTSRLIWHCPYISVFTSLNGQPDGENFREYLILRFNGEVWSFDDGIVNDIQVERRSDFEGWNAWRDRNKEGYDCIVRVLKKDDKITIQTENQGIAISSSSTILDMSHGIYLALTGDQVAITDIHVTRGK